MWRDIVVIIPNNTAEVSAMVEELIAHYDLNQRFPKKYRIACWCLPDEKNNLPLLEKAKPDCIECKGTGSYLVDYNSIGKWDIWEYQKWGSDYRTKCFKENDGYKNDSSLIKVSNIPKKFIKENPQTEIVTPDGVWHNHAEFFEKDHIKIDTAISEIRGIFDTYKDYLAVRCTIHW